jgi:hypothetical protein
MRSSNAVGLIREPVQHDDPANAFYSLGFSGPTQFDAIF